MEPAASAHTHAAASAPFSGGGAASNEAQAPAAQAPPAEPSISLGPAPTNLSHYTAARARTTGSTLTSRGQGRGMRVRAPLLGRRRTSLAHRRPVVGPVWSVLTPVSKPPFRFSAQRDREALSAGDSNTAVCAGGAGDAPVDSEANQRPHAQPPAEPPAPSPRRRLPVADPEPALAPEDEDRMAAIVRRVLRAQRWREGSFQLLCVSARAFFLPTTRRVLTHSPHSHAAAA